MQFYDMPFKKYQLICLDRDGVINQDQQKSVTSLEDFHYIKGALEAIAHLTTHKGKTVVLVTNQACVGRGELSFEGLKSIHDKLEKDLLGQGGHLAKIYCCTDTEVEPNRRRKPAPGMILEALKDFKMLPQNALMIGDDLRDAQAAEAAGVDFVLVLTGKGQKTLQTLNEQKITPRPIAVCESLKEVLDHF